MSTEKPNVGKWIVGIVVLAIVAAVGLRSAVSARIKDSKNTSHISTFDVRKGPLSISVTVSGTIKPLDQEVLKCEVEGSTTILYIIPEGEKVKKGDLLVELDSSRLEDELVDQEIRVFNAEASLVGATEQLAVTKIQARSDIDRAKLDFQFAKEDLKNYIAGTYPQDLKKVDSTITLSKGREKRTQDILEGSKRLHEENFITKTELEADEQDALQAELELELAENEKILLTEFTYERELATLESDVSQSEMALEQVERASSASIMQAKADLKAIELEFERQQGKLEKTKLQLQKTKICAPIDGSVVYATSGQGGHGGGRFGSSIEPLEEGQAVRERQELIHLPTTKDFMCEVSVHESSLAKVRTGLPVRIHVDALRERVFWGRVNFVAPLPDARSSFMNPDLKLYATNINLEGDTEGLRTGMSSRGEIIVEEHDDAIYVPVQCIVREGGKTMAYILDNGNVVPREVQIGLDNNRMIRIIKGLEVGEKTLLAPPLSDSEEVENGGEGTENRPENMKIPPKESGEATQGRASGRPDGGGRRGPEGGQSFRGEGGGGPGRGEGRQGPEGGRGFGGRSGGDRSGGNLSQEEREKRMQERMQSMTKEEREELAERMRQYQQEGGDGGFGGRSGGGGRGPGGGS